MKRALISCFRRSPNVLRLKSATGSRRVRRSRLPSCNRIRRQNKTLRHLDTRSVMRVRESAESFARNAMARKTSRSRKHIVRGSMAKIYVCVNQKPVRHVKVTGRSGARYARAAEKFPPPPNINTLSCLPITAPPGVHS